MRRLCILVVIENDTNPTRQRGRTLHGAPPRIKSMERSPSLARRVSVGQSSCRGLTLLEVLLSLALFLGALAVLSQLWYSGVRASMQSQLRTQAVLRCESKLNEVVAGAVPLQPVSDVPFEDDSSWTWNMQVLPGPHSDVWLVIVNVAHSGQGGLSSSGHQLSRLIRNPQVWINAQQTSTDDQK